MFSDNPDNVEILFFGKSDDCADKLLLIEGMIIENHGSDESCCGVDENYKKFGN